MWRAGRLAPPLNSDLGVAVERQNGQRPGDAPEPPIGWQAGGRWNVPRAVAGMVAVLAGADVLSLTLRGCAIAKVKGRNTELFLEAMGEVLGI